VGTWPIVVRGLETVGLQNVSAHPWGQSLMVRPTVHRVMRVVGGMVVQMALTGARIKIMTGIYFVTVAMLMTLTIIMGSVGLVAVAVLEASLVFVTLIVVLMVGCVLVMD